MSLPEPPHAYFIFNYVFVFEKRVKRRKCEREILCLGRLVMLFYFLIVVLHQRMSVQRFEQQIKVYLSSDGRFILKGQRMKGTKRGHNK